MVWLICCCCLTPCSWEAPGLHECTVSLPFNSAVPSGFGRAPSAALARKVAALDACAKLHAARELDGQLRPTTGLRGSKRNGWRDQLDTHDRCDYVLAICIHPISPVVQLPPALLMARIDEATTVAHLFEIIVVKTDQPAKHRTARPAHESEPHCDNSENTSSEDDAVAGDAIEPTDGDGQYSDGQYSDRDARDEGLESASALFDIPESIPYGALFGCTLPELPPIALDQCASAFNSPGGQDMQAVRHGTALLRQSADGRASSDRCKRLPSHALARHHRPQVSPSSRARQLTVPQAGCAPRRVWQDVRVSVRAARAH